MRLFNRVKKSAAGDEQPVAGVQPARPTPIQGILKNNGAATATVLKKSNIIAAAVIGAVAILAASYYVYTLHEAPSAHVGHKTKPASGPANISVPQQASSASIVAGTRSSPNGAAVNATGTGSGSGSQSAKPTTQEKAFQSAVRGTGGGSTVSWQTTGGPLHGASPVPGASPSVATLPKPKTSVYSTTLVRKEASPFELLQGTVIPATLETGIKSDLPGKISAVVSQPVYSSVSGATVLIPGGSKLVGTYQSRILAGATRVGVVWTRIIFPNGTYMRIGAMPGQDPSGYAGFHDQVNNHTWKVLKGALLLSLINVGMAVASPTSTATNTTGVTGNQALSYSEQALSQTFGQAETQMLQRDINIAPTIKIRPGYAFNVIVTKDLVFPGPYQHGNAIAATAPASVAGPTITNPYSAGKPA
ncbi:MAG: TraB/TrbI/VirB10 family type IV secretion system protein [Acidithiobacillus sp.]